MNTKTKKMRISAILMALTMVVSLFGEITFAPVTAYAEDIVTCMFGHIMEYQYNYRYDRCWYCDKCGYTYYHDAYPIRTISVNNAEHGTVILHGIGMDGSIVLLVDQLDDGYELDKITVQGDTFTIPTTRDEEDENFYYFDMPACNVNVYATFKKASGENTDINCIVTFNDGTTDENVNVTKGDKVSKPSNPARENYIFLGWYEKENDELKSTPFDFDTAIEDNITLYAKWEKKWIGEVESTIEKTAVKGLDDAIGTDGLDSNQYVIGTVKVDSKGKEDVSNEVSSKVDDLKEMNPTITEHYVTIDINKVVSTVVDGEVTKETSSVTDLNAAIEVSIPLSSLGVTTTDKVYVVREHETGAEKEVTEFTQIDSRKTSDFEDGKFYYDSSEKIVYIYSSKFSTYAILTMPASIDIPTNKEHPTLYLKAKVTNKAKKKQSTATLSWKKVKEAQKYEVYGAIANEEGQPAKLATLNKSSYKLTNLEWGKEYVYFIKAIKADGSVLQESLKVYFVTGQNDKSNAKSITAKSIKTNVGQTVQVVAKVNPKEKNKDIFGEKYTKLCRYFSSDPNIAEVNENGEITAKAAGKAKIFIYAPNGVRKDCKVTIK